ncbi:MAG: hypothetical protein LBH60_02480, partial [Prevotellaceae bacterium]|nr:hypothetical protein [Prevotellaceae bacterium]
MVRVIHLILCMFCSLSVLYSQIGYDFESGFSEWIQKPAASWELTPSALSGNFSLMHSRTGVQTRDTIFVPVERITLGQYDVRWKFLLKHTNNPSNANKWAVILAANSIVGDFKGYAVGVNMRTNSTSDDILCLYQVHNDTYTEIIRTDINWETLVGENNIAALEIRRSRNDYWRTGINVGGNFSNISFYADSVMNNAYSDFSYFGIIHAFTASEKASKSLYIDDISIDAAFEASDIETIAPEEQISGGNISSAGNDTVGVLRFGIRSIDDPDIQPVSLCQVTVKNAKPPFCANWKSTIKNAYLYTETNKNLRMTNTVITNDSIVFLIRDDLFISNSDTVDLSMKIVLNDSLTDNSTLQFKIENTDSSIANFEMAVESTNDIVSDIFTIDIKADTILWQNIPDIVSVHSGFPVIAAATDNKGNIDTEFSFPANLVVLSGNVNLTFDPAVFVNGTFNAGNVSYDQPENIAIQLSSESITSVNHHISVIFNQNSNMENSPETVSGTTIDAGAVNLENEIPVFRFVIKDMAGDNTATGVSELKFTNPLSQTNWSNVIGGISLYDGERRLITNILEQKRDYIRVGLFSGSLTVDDGAEKAITLKIWLKTKAPDKTKLVFTIPATDHGCKAMQNGSLFADEFTQDIVSDTFSVEVNATKIIFKNTPASLVPDSPFSLEINAVDNNETIDLDATGEITLAVDNGNLSSVSGITKQMIEGKVEWNDLIIDAPVLFRINARHPLFGETVSSEIASMNTDSEIVPVLSQQKSIFKTTDTLITDAKEIIRLQISDKGTNDNLPTIINKMVFGTIADISIPDLLGGIELLADNQNVLLSYTSSGNQITVVPDNLVIPEGESREIILKMFLKRVKCVDRSRFQLYVPATAHGWTVSSNSSQLLKTFEYPVYSEIHYIDVVASELTILNQPMIVQKDAPFSFEVGATDYTGNVDTSFNDNISVLQSTGTGSLQNISTTQFAGISTFRAIYDSSKYFAFRASSAGMTDETSMPIYSAIHIDTTIKSGTSGWNNTGDWIWNNEKLKHNSGNGLSYVSVPTNIDLSKKIVQWDFTVENENFDPSADNAFWCVLSSNSDNLADENLSGYIAGINYTGNSDLFSVWKVKSGNRQLLWSSDYDWNANITARIIVQKFENDWQIFIKEKERPISFAGKFSDNEPFETGFSGFVFKYTSTRNGMFSINNYEVITTGRPFEIGKAEISDKNHINISFKADVVFPDALNIDHYLITSDFDTLDIFGVDSITDNEVRLFTQLLSDTLLFLSVSGVTDIYGSIIKDTVIKFHRNAPNVNCFLDAVNRNLLILEFDINMVDSIILITNNYRLINTSGDTFSVKNIVKDSGKFYLECDSLHGSTFVLYYSNLETKDGFLLSDSLVLN